MTPVLVQPVPARNSQVNSTKWANRLLPPLAVCLCVHLLLWYGAHGARKNYFDPQSFVKWDAGIYLQIAVFGYALVPCGPNAPEPHPAGAMCGNTGWFPGYPLSIRELLYVRGKSASAKARFPSRDTDATALIFSDLFFLATLIAIWNWFFDATITWTNIVAFSLAAFFPGNIYYNSIFPISAFLFFAVVSAHLLVKERWTASGVAGGVAAFMYSTGFLLAPVAVLVILLQGRSEVPLFTRIWRAVKTAGFISIGFLAVLYVHWRTTGYWNAFFLEDRNHVHGLYNPIATWAIRTHAFFAGEASPPTGYSAVASFQTVFVLGMVLAFLAFAIRSRFMPRLHLYLCVYMLSFWLFPLLVGPYVSLYRSESLLLPAAVLARRLPIGVTASFLGIAVALTPAMAALFFRGILV